MKSSDKYKYWAMLSKYDLETAQILLENKRWVYVSYTCHQALERQLKGMYVYYLNSEAPKTHNLPFIFEKIKSCDSFPEIGELPQECINNFEEFFVEVMYYYMSDYPFSYKNITSRFIKEETAVKLLNSTKNCLEKLIALQQLPEEVDVDFLG